MSRKSKIQPGKIFKNKNNEEFKRIGERNLIFTHEDGRVVNYNSVKEFCKDYNINSSSIYRCLNGKFKQTKGWKVKEII